MEQAFLFDEYCHYLGKPLKFVPWSKVKVMSIRYFLLLCITFLYVNAVDAQEQKYTYAGSDGTRVHLPLGKISFADSVVKFRLGFPRPLTKYRDSTQCLSHPNYKKYNSPDFVSLGCKGDIILKFTDNGFMNLKGNDLIVFEVGPARERTLVEVSEDGKLWLTAGATQGGTSQIDFSDKNIDSTKIFHYVRLRDLKDECAGKSAGADLDAVAAINSVMKLTVNADVLFDVDKFRLKSSADETLETLANAIRQIDDATILVEGHTDSDASDAYNLKLSQNRCITVVERIRALLGHDSKYDYQIKAHGEGKPKVPNDTPENKQINRRVEITVLPPKSYFDTLED